MSYSSTVLADSPIRYYRLNETSGTTAIDYGSQAQNGTLNGGITLNQSRLEVGLDPCMKFDGSTGYISLPTTGLPSGSALWSVEGWFNCTMLAGFFETIAFWGTDANQEMVNLHVDLLFSPARGEISLYSTDINGSSGTVSANTVYYMVATYNGTVVTLYMGGGSIGSPIQIVNASTTPNVTIGAAYIGVNNKGGFVDWMNGYLSEIAIYSTALNLTQITAHYTAALTAPPAGHVAISDGYGGVFS